MRSEFTHATTLTITTITSNIYRTTGSTGNYRVNRVPTVRGVPRKLLTSGQLARELGLAPGTVSRYAREGIITPEVITAGGQYRFDLDRVREELRKRAEERRKQRNE